MNTKSKLATVEPTLVAWVLFDATTDVKYIKMNPADGSLAIFDSEEAAIKAKSLTYGTDYERCEYYSAPQPTPDVVKLVKALEEIINPVRFMQERLEEGMRLNGIAAVQLAEDSEYLRDIAIAALEAYRKQQEPNHDD